ncbi:MAG: ThuA domain-containing protein [Akkermansiaceae bacterium]
MRFLVTCWCLLILFVPTLSAEEEAAQKHVVIVVGTHHYSPHQSMPLFAGTLQKLGLKTTVLNPAWDPEKGDKGIPGLEALAEADLAIFFTRFLKLKDPQLKHITDYLASGKPVIGLRTSTHGFNYPGTNPNAKWNNDFGKDALGTRYLIHLTGKTQLKPVADAQAHPILTGIKPGTDWVSPGTLYLTELPDKGITPLVMGTGNSKRTGKVKNQFGTHELKKEMTDVIAWTWTNKWGGKTFTTSLGHTGDFAVEPSVRLIVNGVYWSLGQDVPAADQTIGTIRIPAKKKK